MKRAAIIVSVVTIGLLVLGIVEDLTNFRWATGDQNAFFGNPNVLLNDGKVALILGGFLALVAALMWIAVTRKGESDQRR
jgi:hypothetical protein